MTDQREGHGAGENTKENEGRGMEGFEKGTQPQGKLSEKDQRVGKKGTNSKEIQRRRREVPGSEGIRKERKEKAGLMRQRPVGEKSKTPAARATQVKNYASTRNRQGGISWLI